MRWNEKILPPFHPPTVFTLYQPQLTHLPTIGGGGGGKCKTSPTGGPVIQREAESWSRHAASGISALGPGPARRAVSRTGGRAGAEHLHANTDGERRAGRERALHHHDRLRGHRGCRGGGRLPAPPLQPGARERPTTRTPRTGTRPSRTTARTTTSNSRFRAASCSPPPAAWT